jgi:hypothetical protein
VSWKITFHHDEKSTLFFLIGDSTKERGCALLRRGRENPFIETSRVYIWCWVNKRIPKICHEREFRLSPFSFSEGEDPLNITFDDRMNRTHDKLDIFLLFGIETIKRKETNHRQRSRSVCFP